MSVKLQIKDFCDDDQTPGHFSHNVEPPNRQNRLCSHRSTWDIISNTPDFINNANPPGSLSDSQLTPQFIVFRAPSRRRRRLAVVLDSPQVRGQSYHIVKKRNTCTLGVDFITPPYITRFQNFLLRNL